MKTHKSFHRYVSNRLLALIGTTALCPLLAAVPVVRPDPAKVAAVERANATLSPTQAFANLEAKAGNWRVENGALVQADPSAPYARTFIKGPRWVDCVIKAKVRVDAVGGPAASPGARLIVRGDEKTDTFYTVGLWAGSREVRIEKSRGLSFEPMTSNQFGTLASAPFPVELGKTYALTVVADHATLYCYIDGMGNYGPQIEFTGLNVAAGNHPVMIEIEAKCSRFEVARVAWATGDGFQAGQEMEFIAGHPGVEFPTHRVTIATDGRPIRALRLQVPAGATVNLKQVRIRELSR